MYFYLDYCFLITEYIVQAKRHILNNTVLDCFKKNIKNETLICNKLAYDTLFYGGNWYDYDVFSNQIRILKNENKSFLNF